MPRRVLRPSDRSAMSVNWSDPVNRNHPLNRGLLSWWLGVPHMQGGAAGTIHDIAGVNDLTTMVNHEFLNGAKNGGTASPSGFGGGFVSLNNGLNGPGISSGSTLHAAREVTVMGWFKQEDGTRGDAVGIWPNSPQRQFILLNGITTDKFHFFVSTSGTNALSSGPSTTTIVDDQWYFIAGTYEITGSTGIARIFTNGVEENSGAILALLRVNGTGTFRLLSNDEATPIPFHGNMDDIRIYDRPLSEGEIMEYYILSQQGYPGILNRWGHRAGHEIVAAVSAGPTLRHPIEYHRHNLTR